MLLNIGGDLNTFLINLSLLLIAITILGSLLWLIKEKKFIVKLLYYDLIFFSSMVFLVVFSIKKEEPLYIDLLILWALIGYIEPISIANFLSKKRVHK